MLFKPATDHNTLFDCNIQPAVVIVCKEVRHSSCSALASIPVHLIPESFSQLLNITDQLNVCAGNPEDHFMARAKKGLFKSRTNTATAILDNYAPVVLNGEPFTEKIRTVACELLVQGVKCSSCKSYRATLRKIYSRWSSCEPSSFTETTSHVNERYLNTTEKKAKMMKMKKRVHSAESEIIKLQKTIKKLNQEQGEKLDNLLCIMKERMIISKKPIQKEASAEFSGDSSFLQPHPRTHVKFDGIP